MSRFTEPAKKHLGQHFLHERGIVEKIVLAVDPRPGDRLVEIGPGQGAITFPLLRRHGALTAIEFDRDLIAPLTEAAREHGALTIVPGDVLDVDFTALAGDGLIRLVGNLPYNISTPLLFHIAQSAARFRDLHFMLQLEVVERMVAEPSTPEYGRLSVMLQTLFEMKKLFRVAPGAFRPPPKVDSAVVRMVPIRDVKLPEGFADLVRRAFSARRKTLRNALGLAPAQFEALQLDPKLRPENLSPQDYVRIAATCAR